MIGTERGVVTADIWRRLVEEDGGGEARAVIGRRNDHVEVVAGEAGHGGVNGVHGAVSGARPEDDGSPAARVVQRAVALDALAGDHAPQQGRRPAVWHRVWWQRCDNGGSERGIT